MKLLLGDCLIKLKELEDNSIDAIVTDPPYGLSFMGKKWDYDVPKMGIWQECLRVLKPGGYLLAFAGTRTQHRMAVNIEDAGFEIRDMIAWVYGSGFPKSLNIGKAVDKLQGNEREEIGRNPNSRENCDKSNTLYESGAVGKTDILTKGTSEWEGWGTALKPALEPITVARKPLSEKSVAENCLKWGVGGINIDGCRVGFDMNSKEDLHAIDQWERQAKSGVKVFNQEGDAKLQKFSQKAPIGRFPANLIHDGSEEVVGLFPQTGQPCGSIKKTTHNDGMFGIGTPGQIFTEQDGNNRSASRFFYTAKASKRERNMGCEGLEDISVSSWHFKCEVCGHTYAEQKEKSGCHCENPKPIPWTGTSKNNHPTVKPLALMEYLVNMVSREGQVILDPFMGSGTTGMACKKLDRDFVGIEMMGEYMEIAKCRIEAVEKKEQLNML